MLIRVVRRCVGIVLLLGIGLLGLVLAAELLLLVGVSLALVGLLRLLGVGADR